jgi:hypothetical protein
MWSADKGRETAGKTVSRTFLPRKVRETIAQFLQLTMEEKEPEVKSDYFQA